MTDSVIPMTQVDLQKLRFAVAQAIPPTWDFEVGRSFVLDQMVWQLKGYMWGQLIGHEQVRWPTDWWQAFKERWFPAWALKRWPVQWTEYDIKAYHAYPKLVIREEQPILRIHAIAITTP